MEFVGDLMNEPWLKAFMFPASGRMTLTVKGVRKAEVAFDDQEPKLQTIMSFQEINSELTLAKINAYSIDQAFGQRCCVMAWTACDFLRDKSGDASSAA
jgi:hypothetical protein